VTKETASLMLTVKEPVSLRAAPFLGGVAISTYACGEHRGAGCPSRFGGCCVGL